MSIDATRWAWQQSLVPSRKLVLLSLADRADEQHCAYPSIARLVKDTGLYRETVMEAVAEMEASGLLRVERRMGAHSRYFLVGVQDRHQSGKADKSGKADRSVKADRTSLEKPTTTSREKPTQNLPIEPTKNRPVVERGTRIPPNWVPSDEEMRWAKEARPDLDIDDVLDTFRNHWESQPGAKGRKVDWGKTWRNWVKSQWAPRRAAQLETKAPPWWTTEEGTMQKGKEMGMDARPGEDMATYRKRIADRIRSAA